MKRILIIAILFCAGIKLTVAIDLETYTFIDRKLNVKVVLKENIGFFMYDICNNNLIQSFLSSNYSLTSDNQNITYYDPTRGYTTTRKWSPSGDCMDYPGAPYFFDKKAGFKKTFDTSLYNDSYGMQSPDICVAFGLDYPMNISFSVESNSSSITGSNIYIIKKNDREWYQDCKIIEPILTGKNTVSFERLEEGLYYVICEGTGILEGDIPVSGEITLSIYGDYIPESGDNIDNAKDVDVNSLFNQYGYDDVVNTCDFWNSGYIGNTFSNDFFFEKDKGGTLKNDVFYKLIIPEYLGKLTIEVSTVYPETTIDDTYLSILDLSGNVIYENDDWYSSNSIVRQAIVKKVFNPGTYYIVTEGAKYDGTIRTTIKASTPTESELNDLKKNIVIDNYIETIDYTDLTGGKIEQIQYFDGLGKQIQKIQKNITTTGSDLVFFTEYDNNGRESKNWLPIVFKNNNGQQVKADIIKNIDPQSVYHNDERLFSEIEYENSSLNRVKGQIGTGQSWYINNKKTEIDYDSNSDSEVKYFYINSNNELVKQGFYPANTLYKTETKDEDGKSYIEYKNLLGQTILERTANLADTYYVYNDLGQLYYVLPPLAANSLSTDRVYTDMWQAIGQFAYKYAYDERGNCVIKKLPGCDSILMVYDKADRLILSQDGNQRLKNQWTITKYDVLGRNIYTGTIIRNQTRVSLKAFLDDLVVTDSFVGLNGFLNTGYTDNYFVNEITPLTVNYYDNYSFRSFTMNGEKLDWSTPPSGFESNHSSAKNLLTGTRTYIFEKVIGNYTSSAIYYDNRGRVIQTQSSNHMNGFSEEYNQYDFIGNLINSKKVQTIPGITPVTEIYNHNFDHAGRLTKTMYKIKNQPLYTLAEYKYDELGRKLVEYRHNKKDSVNYEYNLRNWVTSVKSGTFEEKLYYQDTEGLPLGTVPCYNGNISYQTWTYNTTKRGYQYLYDDFNRLTDAKFKKETSAYYENDFNESFTYNLMGNITTIKRKKNGYLIDDLSMNYWGNQLIRLMDYAGSTNQYNTKEYPATTNNSSGNSLNYDKNGNLISDYDRKIACIRYNLLNLPDTIQFENGNQIIHRYDAKGRKLKTDYYTLPTPVYVPVGTTRQWIQQAGVVNISGNAYVDHVEYPKNTNSLTYSDWAKVFNDVGYTTSSGVTSYYYFRKDHLGNIRETLGTLGLNSNLSVSQRTQYYPSGLPWAEGISVSHQRHKYNGKEFVEMHGLNEYDSEARWYYPAIMRTTTIDPLAEKYYNTSPYAWCGNNPVKFIDPDGRAYNDPESGGTPAEEPKVNIETGKTEGNYTAAQSSTRTEEPIVKIEPRINPNPNNGIIYCTNKLNILKMHNRAMSNEIGRAYSSNPVFKSIAVGGFVVTGSAFYGVSAPSLKLASLKTTISTLNNTQKLINGVNIYAAGTQMSTTANWFSASTIGVGISTGIINSSLPYDAQPISINPKVDTWSMGIQSFINLINIQNEKKGK